MTKPYVDEKVLNAVRCYHWRRRHRKEYNKQIRQWNEKHPERRKEIARTWARKNKENRKEYLQDWRKSNPGKVQAQRKRRRSRQRHRRYHYEVRRGIVVAVTCIICQELVLGQRWGEKMYCKDCKRKVDRKIPRSIIQRLAMHPSFHEMTLELKAWKTIKEMRETRKYSMPI